LANRLAPRGLSWLAALLPVALALVAIGATIRARQVEAETATRLQAAPASSASPAEAQAMADAFALPRLATTLAGLAGHLPSGAPLAAAARNRDGTLRIAIDTADPDELRALLSGDDWFRNFRERGRETRPEGRIRLTLIEDAR
jgi:formylglycine-generating enzyme required for sulfatase activity